MSTATPAVSAIRSTADKRHFWLRKLHSLSGVVPVGGYMAIHLMAENSAIRFKGAAGWNQVAELLGNLPMLQVVEAALLGGILFHGIYGLVIMADARGSMPDSLLRYPAARNWWFFVQRITGLIAFAFIGYHFYTTRLQFYLGQFGARSPVDVTAHWMHGNIFEAPGAIVIYIIGVTASVFHFTNGMWNFLVSWGITVGPRAQRVSAWFWGLAGFGMAAFSLWVLFGFQNV